MNLTEGGEGHTKPHSQETKDKLSVIVKERYKDKTKHPRYGVVMTEETKEKISQSQRGKSPWNKGVSGYNTQPASEERRKKLGRGCEVMGVFIQHRVTQQGHTA